VDSDENGVAKPVIPKSANTGMPSPKILPRRQKDANSAPINLKRKQNWVQNFPENPIYPAYVGLNQPSSTGTGQYYYAPGEGGTAQGIPFTSNRAEVGRGGGESVMHTTEMGDPGQGTDSDLMVELGSDGYPEYAWDSNFEHKPGKTWAPRKDRDISPFPGQGVQPPQYNDIGMESMFYPLEGSLDLGADKELDKSVDPKKLDEVRREYNGGNKRRFSPGGDRGRQAVADSMNPENIRWGDPELVKTVGRGGTDVGQYKVEVWLALDNNGKTGKSWGQEPFFTVFFEMIADASGTAVLNYDTPPFIELAGESKQGKTIDLGKPENAVAKHITKTIPKTVLTKASELMGTQPKVAPQKKTGAAEKGKEETANLLPIETMLLNQSGWKFEDDVDGDTSYIRDDQMTPELKQALQKEPSGGGKKFKWHRWDDPKEPGQIIQKV